MAEIAEMVEDNDSQNLKSETITTKKMCRVNKYTCL
jgi:hypothetical protein